MFPVLLAATLTVAGCGGGAGDSKDSKTVTIGVTNVSESYWKVYEAAAKKHGITVKLKGFTDYQAPNQALASGEIDVNEYQHWQFLATYNVKNHTDLVPVGSTAAYPLPLYSSKHKKVSEFPQGGTVTVPNDPVNEARALLVLDKAGLVELKERNPFVTPADIVEGSSKVKVKPVDASQTAQTLDSVDGAVINNDYAVKAKLPESSILAKDDPAAPEAAAYLNGFVVRKADKDNAVYLQLASIFHEPEVETAVRKSAGDLIVFANKPAAELQATTTQLEAQVREHGAG